MNSPSLRAARLDDAGFLFAMVNQADSLSNKQMTAAAIDWDSHLKWFRARISDPDCLIRIICKDGFDCGQVRLQKRHQSWDADIYVLDRWRGTGLARLGLKLAIDELRLNHPDAAIRAVIRNDNSASIALFTSLGFGSSGVASNEFIEMRLATPDLTGH